jgi:8-oxo-dGTP diphosphatase
LDQAPGVPEFGQRIAGRHYRLRPGAYAVVFNAERRVAVMRTSGGCYLPGGGSEPGESPETTLRREVREECGREIDVVRPIGEAIEYVGSEVSGDGFVKRGAFFEAVFGPVSIVPVEADHTLTWLTPGEAAAVLSNRSHAWAVHEALRPGESRPGRPGVRRRRAGGA